MHEQDQYKERVQREADHLDTELNELRQKAESSSGEEKQGLVNRMEDLKQRKDGLMQQIKKWKGSGKDFFDKLGM